MQVVRDGKVERQAVTFKDWPSPTVIVTEGLRAGDQVVLGAPQVEGARVNVVAAPPRGRDAAR